MYCFDTDTLSAVLRRDPPLSLVRRVAALRPDSQFTTAITLGEMVYGAARRGDPNLEHRVRDLILRLTQVLPFDEPAAEAYGHLRARLEREGHRLAEPDTRIAAIALSRNFVLVTGNVRHFDRVPDLTVENWIP
jgi:tRNA(fMet)-specific endonuclease VapC